MKVLAENLMIKTKYADELGCSVRAAEYVNGGLAIQLHTADGALMLTASVFIEGRSEKLLPFQFYSKDWSENEGVVEWLKKAEIVTGTGRYVKTGFCEAELLELSPKYRKIIDTARERRKRMKNPIQPLMKDANGVVRFKGNAIVQHLLDTHPTCDMNRLACMDFTDDDQQQFAQLIGYSLSGYGDLSYVDDRAYATAAEPNRNWCAGCSPDNCSGCGDDPVESEPAVNECRLTLIHQIHELADHIERAAPSVTDSDMRKQMLGQREYALKVSAKWNMNGNPFSPQPDRVTELEAETTKLKLDLLTSYGEAEELSGKVAELEDQIAVLQEQIDLQIPAGVMIAQMKRIAELEAALRVAREALDNCAADYLHADSVLTDSALAKINEVLK